jgi:hypothetical protein
MPFMNKFATVNGLSPKTRLLLKRFVFLKTDDDDAEPPIQLSTMKSPQIMKQACS